MTGAQIKTLVESLVSDSPGDTWFYGALNAAKDSVEAERAWEFLKKLNSSATASSGSDTSAKTLPSDFAEPLSLTIGTDGDPLSLVSMGDSRMLRSESGYWYIDWANSQYYILGSSAGGTIYNLYKRFTDDIESGTSPVWPSRFHRLLAYDVAKAWFYQNAGEREFNWSPEMEAEAKRLRDAMVLWDERLKSLQENNRPVPQMNV